MEPSPSRRQVAFLVNPIAGMGGAVALKGTDGEALKEALARGATPRAPARASDFVRAAAALSLSIRWLTCAGPMGENVLASAKTPHEVVSKPHGAVTTPADTAAACRVFLDRKVDLIAFVGGDGTAKDIFAVVGDRVPLLGIPSGVKMHSGVFAITPRAAAELLQAFLDGRTRIEEGEIVDEDEAAMSRGVIEVNLAGAAKMLVFE